MNRALIVTLVGPDRPGIVESVAKTVATYHGNWEASHMARLAGRFAGILHIEVDELERDALADALQQLQRDGLDVVTDGGDAADAAANEKVPPGQRRVSVTLLGADQPGIVREVSQRLVEHQCNVVELETELREAPMAGGRLFSMRATLLCPDALSNEPLRAALEALADSLMVDIEIGDES